MTVPRPLFLLLVVSLLGSIACGGSSGSPRAATPSAGSATPATGGPQAPAATPLPQSAASPAAPAALTDAPQVIARDNVFVPADLRVPAGRPVRLTLRNEGLALHDWQVLRAANPDGSPIKTQLVAAGGTATVTFTIFAAGTYATFCEVHPVEMRG